MYCQVCKRSPLNGEDPIFRINKLGVKGIWRCYKHLTKRQKSKLDPQTKKIVDIIDEPRLIRQKVSQK